MTDSPGRSLGRALANEPELTRPAEPGFADMFAEFLGRDGWTCAAALRRLEILKCEAIVNGESFSQALKRLTTAPGPNPEGEPPCSSPT